jgi:uncharacterized SAM-binding protein YcdF (DUF218 family)
VTKRLVAVLGYSNGGSVLHDVCASRLRRAEAEAQPGDVVLLSGWSGRRGSRSEAELMAEAWRGPDVDLVVSGDARTTYGNARATRTAAAARGANRVVLVTSSWHAPRAAALFRAALRGTGIALSLSPADGPAPRRTRLREIVCWLLTPAQSAALRRRGGVAGEPSGPGRRNIDEGQ